MTQIQSPLETAPSLDAIADGKPEGLVEDLVLADHQKGYWPSSKNVTQ